MATKIAASLPMQMNRSRAFDHRHGVQRLTKGLLLDVLREEVQNGDDAILVRQSESGPFEHHIFITIDPKQKLFLVADNGVGLTPQNQLGLSKVFDSVKEGNSVGLAGQFGTGRLKALQICTKIVYVSKTTLQPHGVHYTLDHEQVRKAEMNEKADAVFYEGTPDWFRWPFEKNDTGTVVRLYLTDENWNCLPGKIDGYLDALSGFFRPSVPRMIRVNGKPLKQRAIVEDRVVQGSAECPDLGGTVSWELFIPEQWRVNTDDLHIGGMNPITTMASFLKDMQDPELKDEMPEILKDGGKVGGHILMPALNKHVAENRKELKGSVYRGLHKTIIKFIAEVIGPKLDEAFRKIEQEAARNRKRNVLRQLAEGLPEIEEVNDDLGLGEGGGDEGTKDGKPSKLPDLKVDQTSVYVMPGDAWTFNVTRHQGIPENNLVWDASNAGGELSVDRGLTTTFLAGANLGTFSLRVYNAKDETKSVEIAIVIEPYRSIRISPKGIGIERGENRKFKLKGHDASMGKVEWTVNGKHIRLKEQTNQSVLVEVGENAVLDTYELHAKAKNGTETFTTFRVVDPDTGPSIVLDGVRFYLRAATTSLPSLFYFWKKEIDLKSGRIHGKIEVNFDHPDFIAMSEGSKQHAFREFMLQRIFLEYALYLSQKGALDVGGEAQKALTLSSAFAQAGTKKTKKD